MNNNPCGIVNDLLPLYAENICSKDSKSFIEEHIASCQQCRQALHTLQCAEPLLEGAKKENPLLYIKRKIKHKMQKNILFYVCISLALLMLLLYQLFIPRFLPYEEHLVKVDKAGEQTLILQFSEKISRYTIETLSIDNPAEDTISEIHQISAWYTFWDKISRQSAKKTLQITFARPSALLLYDQNNGTESICLYGNPGNMGISTLPRLFLSVYFLFALGSLLILAALSLLFKERKKFSRLFIYLAAFPFCYIISHICVKGFQMTSHHATEDFFAIFLTGLFLYGAFLAKAIRQKTPNI